MLIYVNRQPVLTVLLQLFLSQISPPSDTGYARSQLAGSSERIHLSQSRSASLRRARWPCVHSQSHITWRAYGRFGGVCCRDYG